MARRRKLTQKFAGLPMLKLGVNRFTYPFTHSFSKEFVGLDNLALDLNFAADQSFSKPSTLAATETQIISRKGPSPIFSRGTMGTKIGPTGLIEYAPENLITQSEALGSFGTVFGTTVSSANISVAPNGTLTAEKLIESSANEEHGIFQSQTTSGTCAFSAYFKADGRRYAVLRKDSTGSGFAVFDLQDGLVTQVSNTTATIENAGNGWWRCKMITTAISTCVIKLSNIATGVTGNSSYLGNGVSGIFVWGIQLERSTVARQYIPTTTGPVYGPRFDYDPITLACKGLLIEESRTNLLSYSSQFENTSGWNQTRAFATADSTSSPSGQNDADLLTARTVSYGGILRRATNISYAVNTTYAMSVYAKAGTATYIGFRMSDESQTAMGLYPTFNLSGSGSFSGGTPIGGTIVSGSCTSVGNGWYRCVLVYTTAASSTGGTTDIAIVQSNGNTNYTPAGTETVYLWGAQLEAGTFATSYIPTTTTSLTRSADVCSISSISSFYAGLGTLYVKSQLNGASILNGICGFNTSNTLQIAINRLVNNTRAITFGATPTITINSGTLVSTLLVKSAFAFAANDAAFANNGTLSGTSTSVALPSVSAFQIGSNGGQVIQSGWISEIKYFGKRLSNTKLQSITA